MTSRKFLRWLSLQLLKVNTRKAAADWTARLQEFEQSYGAWLDEKTYIKDVHRDDIPQKFRKNKSYFYTTTGIEVRGNYWKN